ncbi:MAG: alpha/beta hydrolase [Labilithrix sp.]|nr:alpha/beta hydrolase [Labilithrix sp.]MCW5836303.1 alpha/beta hydrolase [Labilithrix sp.]
MPFVTRPGASIHYATHGAEGAPAVVLLQGLGLSSRFWFDVPERLTSDAARPRRVIAVDNRGTGKSGRPRPPWTMGTMADDVAAVLDDAGVDDAVVVGISMGGMIAQHVALRHRARVRGLVLLATTPGFLAGALPEPVSLYRLLSMPFRGREPSADMARLLLPPSKWGRAREIFRDWPAAMRDDPTPPATFAAHLFAASTHFVAPRLARIDCPAVVATGAEDLLIPKRNAEVLARRLPRAELELVPDTGHALFADDRDLVRRLVERLEQRLD